MQRKRNSCFWIVGLLVWATNSWAQTTNTNNKTLSQDEFISIVKKYHPVVRQASIGVERAKANLLENRGAFDPTIGADYSTKTFGGKGYYDYFNPEIVIPTWFGIDLKAGTEKIEGDRASNELTMGESSYIGVKMGLHQLLFDKRRAILQQAKSMVKLSRAEQELILNDLLFDAIAAYWLWVRNYEIYRIVQDALEVSKDRFRFVKVEYEQGSKPAIDTTEALTQLQTFQMLAQSTKLEWQNAGLMLSNYLWLQDQKAMDWNENIIPMDNQINEAYPIPPALETLLETAAISHPKLRSLDFKIDILETERKLKAQSFIPKLSVSGNALNNGFTFANPTDRLLLENNHKLGVDLSVPLFMRQARGAYKQARLKIEETNLQQDITALEINNKIKSYYNEVFNLQGQINTFEDAYKNYSRLYQGEVIRFTNGESTLFVMNARQNKVLEVAQKLVELKAKWRKSYAGLLWSAAALD
jgi:outer membrane protein TolC